LGAQGRHVMGQVVGSGMRQVAIGTVAGTAGALILSQFLASVAPAEGAWSPLVWLAAPASLALALLMAGVLPARRALTSNPLMIMRSE
jgi:predicted lysophospholipase L1 biosynthesis ABC-type transport system permease subunit